MIEITGLWKRFGRFDAIQGLSQGIPGGSAFALIGANGAGKTTMIKTLMNVLEMASLKTIGESRSQRSRCLRPLDQLWRQPLRQRVDRIVMMLILALEFVELAGEGRIGR